MFCTYRTLLVIIALNVPSIGGAEVPAVARTSRKADAWPTLEWKKAAPSPFARVESPAAVVDSKICLFGGFTEDLDASNQVNVYNPMSDSWTRKKDMPRLTHLNPAIDGNTIWFAGGFKGTHPGPVTAEVWKYDIASDTRLQVQVILELPWTKGPAISTSRLAKKASGKLLWDTVLRAPARTSVPGDEEFRTFGKDTGLAAPTACTDGKRVYAFFGTGVLGCVGFDGRQVWAGRLVRSKPRNVYGLAASPVLYGDVVI